MTCTHRDRLEEAARGGGWEREREREGETGDFLSLFIHSLQTETKARDEVSESCLLLCVLWFLQIFLVTDLSCPVTGLSLCCFFSCYAVIFLVIDPS